MKVVAFQAIFWLLILLPSCTTDSQIDEALFLAQEEYRAAKFARYPDQNDTLISRGTSMVVSNPYYDSGLLRLKGAMHNHTENSASVDGYLSGGTPKWTCEKYRDEAGYDFISITDHNFMSTVPEVRDIVWMGPSLEDTNTDANGHHLIVYNLPEGYQFHFISNDINEQIDYYHSLGAFVSYAHADWRPQYQPDEKIISVRQLDFVEVFNNGDGSIRAYNSMLLKGPVMALGTDDFHYNPERYEANKYFNKSYIIVYGHKKERKAIWDDILRGHFYASTGARMEITYADGTIEVTTDKPSIIEFHGVDPQHPTADVILETSKDIFDATYHIDGSQPVIWAKISNSDGEAISQAFHVKKI